MSRAGCFTRSCGKCFRCVAAKSDPTTFPIRTAEPLQGDDFYLVSGNAISVMRNGKVVNLAGTELERVRRWVLDRSEPT